MARKKVRISNERMQKQVEDSKSGGSYKFKEGQTKIFLCPPMFNEDAVAFVTVKKAYNLGPDGKSSYTSMRGLKRIEPFLEALARHNKSFDDVIEADEVFENLVSTHGDPAKNRLRNAHYCNIVEIAHRTAPSRRWEEGSLKVTRALFGKTLFEKCSDKLFDNPELVDEDNPIYLVVKRTGTGLKTEYDLDLDSTSLVKENPLPEDCIEHLDEVFEEGKDADIYDMLARMVKTPAQVMSLFGIDSDDDDDDDRPARKVKVSKRAKKKAPAPKDDADDQGANEQDEEGDALGEKLRRRRPRRSSGDGDDFV